MFMERSTAHRHQLSAKIETEIARETERQMEIQHRLHRADQNEERYDGSILYLIVKIFFLNIISNRSLFASCLHAVSIGQCLQSKSISIFSFYWSVQSQSMTFFLNLKSIHV